MLGAAKKAVELARRNQVPSIFVNKDTKVIVQGITGSQGSFHACATATTAPRSWPATAPKKAGTDVDGIPVFASVAEAKDATGATASMILVPASEAPPRPSSRRPRPRWNSCIVSITEGMPAQDEARDFNERAS